MRTHIPMTMRVASRHLTATAEPLPGAFEANEAGLMTRPEYLRHLNPDGTRHPSNAYDWDSFKMNESRRRREVGVAEAGRTGDRYTVFESSAGKYFVHDGRIVAVLHDWTLYHEPTTVGAGVPDDYSSRARSFRRPEDDYIPLDIAKRKRVKYVQDYLPLVDDLARANARRYPVILRHLEAGGETLTLRAEDTPVRDGGTSLAILDSEGRIAAVAESEYGATLIAVAQEARGKGLGKVLAKVWHDLNPKYESGGMTEAGEALMSAFWEGRVREFVSNGWYDQLVRDGRMTRERVDAVLSALPPGGRPTARPDAQVQPTGEVLVMSDGSTFVTVYDRAFLEAQDDRFIHGHAFLRDAPNVGTFVYSIEYDRPFADLTTRAILQLARDNGERLYDGRGYHDLLEGVEDLPGVERDGDHIAVSQDLLPLRTLAAKERRTRKAVDPYGEIETLVMEQADAKWR